MRKLHPGERIYTFWDYFRMPGDAMPGCALIICCSARQPLSASLARASIAKSAAGRRRAIMRRLGWKSRILPRTLLSARNGLLRDSTSVG